MHDTARCLGYPSDSTRAARERARETISGSHLDRAGQARMGWTLPPQAPAAPQLAPVAHLSPPWLNSRPRGSTLAPVAHHRLSSLPWLSSPPLWLNSLTSGRRRRLATSHWPWAYSLGCSRACQIKPDRIATVVVIGVQWGGLGLARFAGGLPTRSLSPGRRRRSATSHWPWAYSLGCSRACQIKLDRIVTAVVIGVQWGGLGLARFAGGLRHGAMFTSTAPTTGYILVIYPSYTWYMPLKMSYTRYIHRIY